MGEPVETRSERISTGRAMDARPAMHPWSGGRGFMAERARSWGNPQIHGFTIIIHQPTKVLEKSKCLEP